MEKFSLERYIRHQEIEWLDQNELFQKHILVVGVGAIGNEVLKNLVLLGIGNITIIDYDRIEVHNLSRSVLFRENDIGKYKVEVAKERAKELNPDPRINIRTINANFYDVVNIKFLKQFDGVFCAVDNFESRIRLHRLCFLAKVHFFNAGIDSQYVSVEYFPYKNKRDVCFECNLSPKIYQSLEKRYSCGWIERTALSMQKIPTTIITASISASMLVSMFVREKEYKESLKFFMNTIDLSITSLQLRNNPYCYFCISWKNVKEISLKEFLLNVHRLSEDTTLFSNEPILVSLSCETCKIYKKIWDLSRKFKEKDIICPNCNQMMRVDVRDHFTKDEIQFLLHIPFKYLYYFDPSNETTVLVVLEDDRLEK